MRAHRTFRIASVIGAELSSDQRRKVADYWWSRAQGEITSWVGFQHVLADLRAERAPDAVVALAERAVNDEHQHALFCRDWARRFGHETAHELRPRSLRPLTFHGASEDDNRVLRIGLCCFTETVGCFVLQHVRRVVTDAELRKLNQRHTADELQHSRVGWGYFAMLDARRRDLLRARLPELLELLERTCCAGSEEPDEELVPFGYFTPRLLRAAHDDALRELIKPGLLHHGITRAA